MVTRAPHTRRHRGRTILDLTCEHCGATFQRQKGSESPRAFCSQKCYLASDYHAQTVAAANAARRVNTWVTKPCGTCGVPVKRAAAKPPERFFCSRACYIAKQRSGHPIQVNASGYVLVFVGRDYPGASKSGHILEHRKVMQELLGRPLLPAENVHHINGVKDDNRPENLELWTTSQPQGQRVADKIAWAREFLAFYEAQGEAHAEVP
jgi:endogenous inhibitor of DNA gyrase (YacG/DUF329 family)